MTEPNFAFEELEDFFVLVSAMMRADNFAQREGLERLVIEYQQTIVRGQMAIGVTGASAVPHGKRVLERAYARLGRRPPVFVDKVDELAGDVVFIKPS